MSKYDRTITGTIKKSRFLPALSPDDKAIPATVTQSQQVTVDVYDVLKAFDVKCPALQHLIKKALCAGLRGHKDITQDLEDIKASAERAIELNKT